MKSRIDLYKELFSDLNHNKRVISFSNFNKEYRSFYDYSSVYDSSHSSIFYITGNDALDFLHRISTADFLNQQDYSTKVTLFLNEKGRIIDRLRVLIFPDHLILIGSPDNEERISRWIEKYAVMDDIKVKPVTGNYLYLKILGKKVEILFTLLFGDQLKDLEVGKIYKYIADDFQCWIYKDEILLQHFGYEIFCDELYSENLIKYIHSNLETFNCEFIGTETFETIRIEQGEPSYPNEITDEYNPYDVNLTKFISYTKGCYIGQEVIARLDTYDKARFNFTGLRLMKDYDFVDKTIYNKDQKAVGELTSKTYSPNMKSYVALGIYIKKLSEDELNNLFVKKGEELIKVEIINLPMIKL